MELKVINKELSNGQSELKEQLQGVKKAVRAIIEMTTDSSTKEALLTTLDSKDNG
jgi:predicted transcriptional regulator